MPSDKELAKRIPLECLVDVSDRAWMLVGLGELPDGSCLIADTADAGDALPVGFFDGSTGDVFVCRDGEAAPDLADGPAVHIVGSLNGTTGQVNVRQEQGHYLRICRWDRIESDLPTLQGALLRTLPQCGCGGSLGTPKLFASFAEMSAYHFCAFYLG